MDIDHYSFAHWRRYAVGCYAQIRTHVRTSHLGQPQSLSLVQWNWNKNKHNVTKMCAFISIILRLYYCVCCRKNLTPSASFSSFFDDTGWFKLKINRIFFFRMHYSPRFKIFIPNWFRCFSLHSRVIFPSVFFTLKTLRIISHCIVCKA